jgi:hypothetical protein
MRGAVWKNGVLLSRAAHPTLRYYFCNAARLS